MTGDRALRALTKVFMALSFLPGFGILKTVKHMAVAQNDKTAVPTAPTQPGTDKPVERVPMASSSAAVEATFNHLAQQWYRETGMLSLLHQKTMHPAYQKIIGMGKDVLPLIFHELKQKRNHWLWALCAITQEDPADSKHNFNEAVEAWLKWGEQHGYV